MRISLATTRNEKALAKMHVQATQPKFQTEQVMHEGAVCIKASVLNASSNRALVVTCQRLGMVAASGQDCWSMIVTSTEAFDTVRNTLKPLFS
jgi:hypothetical protein